MADNSATQSSPSFAPDQVAPLLPATALAPEPARHVNFLFALLAYWLVPKRIGPHLAVATWKRAWAAHFIALFLAVVLPILIVAGFEWLHGFGLHELRKAAALGVVSIASVLASVPAGYLAFVVFGPIPALQIVLILLAILLMPWCAGGDSAWSVFKRCLKNVYWSTTYWPLIAVAVAWCIAEGNRENSWLKGYRDLTLIAIALFLTGTPVFLWIRALLVGAGRYVGPAVGPAFKPREPLCDKCGYCITGLGLAANCPECGEPVRESLPGGRRKPTLWQQYSFQPRGILEAARLQWTILRDRSFFERLPVHEGHAAARHFWWATLLFLLVAVMLVCWVIFPIILRAAGRSGFDIVGARSLAAVVGLLAPFALQVLFSFAACLWAQVRLGIRDHRVSATVCYYASPLMWPTVAVLVAGGILPYLIPGRTFPGRPLWVLLGLEIYPGTLIVLGYLGVLGAALGLWWLRLLRALRSVQHANV